MQYAPFPEGRPRIYCRHRADDDAILQNLFDQPFAVAQKKNFSHPRFKSKFILNLPEFYIGIFQINPVVTPVRDCAAVQQGCQPAAAACDQAIVDPVPIQPGVQGL